MKDNIRAFIENRLEKNPKKMRTSLLLVNFFPMMGIAYGLILGGAYRTFSALIMSSILVAFALVVILTRKHTVIRTIISGICFNLFTASNYFMFAMILYFMQSKVCSNFVLLFLPPVLATILIVIITVQSMKREKESPPKRENALIGAIAGATSVATYFMLRGLNVAMKQNVALLVGAILLTLLASLFIIFGVLDVLKLYYIKKFHIAFDK